MSLFNIALSSPMLQQDKDNKKACVGKDAGFEGKQVSFTYLEFEAFRC